MNGQMDGQTDGQTGANLNAPWLSSWGLKNSLLQRSNPHPRPVDYVLSLPGTLSRFTSKSKIPNQGSYVYLIYVLVFVRFYLLLLAKVKYCRWQISWRVYITPYFSTIFSKGKQFFNLPKKNLLYEEQSLFFRSWSSLQMEEIMKMAELLPFRVLSWFHRVLAPRL